MSSGTSARRWVLAAAVASFAAGLTVGLVAPAIVQAVAPGESLDGDERLARYLIDTYGLDSAQGQQVRMVLAARAQEKQRVLMRELDRLPEALRIEIGNIDRRASDRIKYVLTGEQRERFLRDSALMLEAVGTDPVDPAQAEDR